MKRIVCWIIGHQYITRFHVQGTSHYKMCTRCRKKLFWDWNTSGWK